MEIFVWRVWGVGEEGCWVRGHCGGIQWNLLCCQSAMAHFFDPQLKSLEVAPKTSLAYYESAKNDKPFLHRRTDVVHVE